MTPMKRVRLRDDVVGGIVSAAVAIPLALGFGMFVFVTLGDAYFVRGAQAGAIAAFVAGIVCVLLGERSTIVYAPRITTTFFLGALLYSLAHSSEPGLQGASAAFTLLVLFAIILLAGLFEALFGCLRLGTLIKFAPHPVMAGFQNMAATLLFLVQLGNVMGFEHNVPFTRVLGEIADAKPLSVVVATMTFAAMWFARRIVKGVPPLLVGLAIGLAAYYGLVLVGLSAALGPMIDTARSTASVPAPYLALTEPTMLRQIANLAPIIFPSALALATIAAIDATLCARLASSPNEQRGDSNRMLLRLGLANAAAAAFGGITSGINIGASVTNRSFGGHSRVSVIVNAALLFATILMVGPIANHLPRAVLSALIMVIAVQHIDPWSKQATIRLLKGGIVGSHALALDLGVAILVSLLSITVNIVLAVFLGIALAVSLFLLHMSRSSIRRLYRCNTMRSRRARATDELKMLEDHGSSILVIELQNALFFGSAERLAQVIEVETTRSTKALILDLRRVTGIDSTGVRILAEVEAGISRRGIILLLVLRDNSETKERLAELPARRQPDLDRAIEQAENDLLGMLAPADHLPLELPLEKVSILRDLTSAQIERLRPYLERRQLSAGSIVFEEGDPGTHLFLVTQGHASVRLMSHGENIRLATFAPGTVFGELAILDGGPRSATVTADDALTAFTLSEDGFAALNAREPDVAIKILSALGRELSRRLRHANMTIHQLEI